MRPTLSAALLAVIGLMGSVWPSPVYAYGALAIGLPSEVSKSGFSAGTSWNYSTTDAAEAKALEECHASGSDQSKALCQIIATFQNHCVAVAMDPQAGTPGVGWAVAVDKPHAENHALANCYVTAEARRDYCKIVASACDAMAGFWRR